LELIDVEIEGTAIHLFDAGAPIGSHLEFSQDCNTEELRGVLAE